MNTINYKHLMQYGEIIETAEEGTVILAKYNDVDYVILQDNTVITREEDNKRGKDLAFFPFNF